MNFHHGVCPTTITTTQDAWKETTMTSNQLICLVVWQQIEVLSNETFLHVM
jgi:hypothetical protein